jgi:ribosomal protein S11
MIQKIQKIKKRKTPSQIFKKKKKNIIYVKKKKHFYKKKRIFFYKVHIKQNRKNVFVTLTNYNGDVLRGTSSGMYQYKGYQKRGHFAYERQLKAVVKYLLKSRSNRLAIYFIKTKPRIKKLLRYFYRLKRKKNPRMINAEIDEKNITINNANSEERPFYQNIHDKKFVMSNKQVHQPKNLFHYILPDSKLNTQAPSYPEIKKEATYKLLSIVVRTKLNYNGCRLPKPRRL